jgi:hypothetical protein
MHPILQNVLSQHIDFNGKTRVLNYENVSLMVSPLPPLDIVETSLDDTHFSTIENALIFVGEKELEIVEQDGDESKKIIQGLWVKIKKKEDKHNSSPIIVFGYIPVEVTNTKNALKKIPYSSELINDPVFVGETSQLNTFLQNAKIAEYLKEFSIREWSLDPVNFSIKNYVVVPQHQYKTSIGNKFERNKNFYSSKKIIVPDNETAERLFSFVKISAMNDPLLKAKYSGDNATVNASKLYVTE